MSDWTWQLERQQGRWTQKVTNRFMRGTKLGHKDGHPCSILPYFPDFICHFSQSFYSSTLLLAVYSGFCTACSFGLKISSQVSTWLILHILHNCAQMSPSQWTANHSPHSHTFDYFVLLCSVYIALSCNILSLVIPNVHFYVPFLEYKF